MSNKKKKNAPAKSGAKQNVQSAQAAPAAKTSVAKEILVPTITLFIICLVVAAALAGTNMLTIERITQNNLETQAAAQRLVLDADSYEQTEYNAQKGVTVFEAYSKSGSADDYMVVSPDLSSGDISQLPTVATPTDLASEGSVSDESLSPADLSESDLSATDTATGKGSLVGYVVMSAGKGYGGDVEIMVGINLAGQVTGVTVLSHEETPGLGANCEDELWLNKFVGAESEEKLAVNKDGGEIDALTSATITSRAVTEGVNKALYAFRVVTGLEKVEEEADLSASDLSGSDLSASDAAKTVTANASGNSAR